MACSRRCRRSRRRGASMSAPSRHSRSVRGWWTSRPSTVRIVAATDAKIARGEDVALQAAVWAAIESGEHPIRAIRKYRGLTQIDVAEQAGLRQGYIADIEAGKKTGSATSLKAIAAALGVPLDVIVG
jgi:DNA-binding XRE family transcriptional regulator